jgi:hypothetical protein
MWINEKGNLVAMKTNYLDNIYITGKFENGVQVGGFVDQHTIDDFESDKRNDYGYYRVYGLGDWGKLRTGGEFWKDFNTTRHVVQTTWAEDYPLHITWDENVNPFLTCLVWQLYSPKVLEAVQDGKRVADTLGAGITWDGKSYIAIQLDEICLEDPRNRVKDVCTEFKSRYPQHRTKGLFVYGDRTSIKEDTKLEKGENFFTKIMSHVTDYRPTLRMQGANPSVVDSRDFINQCYVNNGGVQIFINLKCKKSLYDYQYALEDSDGTLKKTKKTNPVTKVSFEEFGHPSDAKRYLLTVAFSEQFQIYLRGGRKNSIKLGANNSKNTW